MATLIRLAIGAVIASIVTFGLFTLMQILISGEWEEPENVADNLNIEITKMEQESDVISRNDRPDEPPQVKTPPPPPRIEAAKAEAPKEGLATTLGRLPELTPEKVDSGDVQFVVSDREVQPLVRMEPQYPRRALERGTEGSCVVRFDVNPDGTTTNIVPECTSPMFDRSVETAVSGWKYQPKIQDGQAVMRFGLEVEFPFRLEGN